MEKKHSGLRDTKVIILSGVLMLLFILAFVLQFASTIFKSDVQRDKNAYQENTMNTVSEITLFPQEKTILNNDYFFMELRSENKNIAEEALWKSSDESIARVSDTPGTKGQITTGGNPGTVTISAQYQEKTYTSTIQVEGAKLEVFCFPFKTPVKVGEEVMWILLYKELGVPNYTYEWSGDVSSTDAAPETSFSTPGMKRVHIKTVDVVGNVAEADCDPLEVVK